MISKIIIFIFHVFLISLQPEPSKARTWVRVGYYMYEVQSFTISDINSTLFTHLISGFATLNSTSYQVSLSVSDVELFSTFTKTVKQKNPSVTTLLSIDGYSDYSIYSSMVRNSSYRKSFIDSSIKLARLYDFQGIDLWWKPDGVTMSDMSNMGVLFEEWRSAVISEARNSELPQLLLTAAVEYTPNYYSANFPFDSMRKCLNWIHLVTADYVLPQNINIAAAPSALYNPGNVTNTDNGIRAWIAAGFPANKLVMVLPYYGLAWTLVDSKENGIGAPAIGADLGNDGCVMFTDIRNDIERYRPTVMYNETYVVNYFSVGTLWIGYDDVEAIRRKVSYAKEKGLLGYFVWQISYDSNWVLSQAALEGKIKFSANNTNNYQQNNNNQQNKWRRLLVIVLTPVLVAVFLFVCGCVMYRWRKKLKIKESENNINHATAAAQDLNSGVPNLMLYSFDEIEAATNRFSIENKLGEGGYGPVYKGILPDGQEVAIKKLSQTSTQGFEEFKNEVMLTAKLQHVNLVQLLGFCIDKEEYVLIYEYMSNKSLDYYLFDPVKKYLLDWEKRIHIIEGICQGLLYLQEYSRLTIIHRDLKASNVLLDEDMKPKISDFGMARIFIKDNLEANTKRIVGTYGYAPPEYIKRGIYSIKSDVYSFGILLLQIISGKKVSILYGENEDLSLLEYAYELWKEGKAMEFMDPSLDHTNSPCKLTKCMHIALLCVQKAPIDRPSMLEVVWMLRNEAADLMMPKNLGSSTQPDEDMQYDSTTSNLEIGSINDVTLSTMDGR